METPKFNNKPNNRIQLKYTTEHGTQHLDYWISRSVAVVGVIFAFKNDATVNVLITKRSKNMRDEGNKYCVPCGYIDWQETGYDAMVREVYEETSLYLPEYKDYIHFNNNSKPFTVHDNPDSDSRQNVSLIYVNIYDFNKSMDKYPYNIIDYRNKETAEVIWMTLNEFYDKYEQEYKWAFKHNETIREAMKFYNYYGT